MSDEKKKCSGCGRDVTGDICWCMSCRSILYTDLLIARTDFSGSQFKTLVFPVRDIIWMQDRIRLREAELKAADDTNDMISAELARLRAELEQAKSDVERWSSSSGFFSDSLAMANESAAVLQAERDKYAAALVEIRGICTAMMDGWGQTVTVLDKIRKITLTAIKRQPTEPPHRPETFA